MSKASKKFSKSWKSSKKPSKQRKYRYNAPLHIKHKFVRTLLSKELRKRHKKRNIAVRKGDKVRVMRGSFKKKEGKVEIVDLKKGLIYVNGIQLTKRDGTKAQKFLHPSNLMLIELNTEDKFRQKLLERK